jgi:hypothetical protein
MAAEPIPFNPSSHITGAAYDDDTQELAITFSGKSTYIYSGVTKDVADEFSAAGSAGQFLDSVIKKNPGMYPFRKA